MDREVLAALARWPDVPHVFGWLRLDRRGEWRLLDEPVRHAGFAAFIGRNYEADAAGNWFFQNGPQRVYVRLDYTPWVLRLEDGRLRRQNGTACPPADSAYLDNEGSLLIAAGGTPGLVDDRDLPLLLDRLCDERGMPLVAADVEALLEGRGPAGRLRIADRLLPIQRIDRDDLIRRYAFNPDPQPVV